MIKKASLSLLTLSLFTRSLSLFTRSLSLSSNNNIGNSKNSLLLSLFNSKNSLSLVSSQLSYCHTVLEQVLINKNDNHIVIDATCGNGWDSLKLADLCISNTTGMLYCIDINNDAIKRTFDRLKSKVNIDDNIFNNRIHFFCQSHEYFPIEIKKETVSTIIYNLGFLPNSSNNNSNSPITTTCADITVKSLSNAILLLKSGGTIIITAYVGHPGGLEENLAIEQLLVQLDKAIFRVTKNTTINQENAPILYTIFRKKWPMKPLRE